MFPGEEDVWEVVLKTNCSALAAHILHILSTMYGTEIFCLRRKAQRTQLTNKEKHKTGKWVKKAVMALGKILQKRRHSYRYMYLNR